MLSLFHTFYKSFNISNVFNNRLFNSIYGTPLGQVVTKVQNIHWGVKQD